MKRRSLAFPCLLASLLAAAVLLALLSPAPLLAGYNLSPGDGPGTPAPTASATATAVRTPTPTRTPAATATPSATATATGTRAPTPAATGTSSATAAAASSVGATATGTPGSTIAPTRLPSTTATATGTARPVSALQETPTPTATVGPCSVSGLIGGDRTWGPGLCSSYIVTGNVVVESGQTLTIEPGTIVRFNSLKAITVQGTMVARGTAASPITFTSTQSAPSPGDWGYIYFGPSSTTAAFDDNGNYLGGGILQYVIIEYAGGLAVDGENSAVFIVGSSPYIDHNTIRSNQGWGTHVHNVPSLVTISNNTITGNVGGGGIRASYSAVTISNNTIIGNTAGIGASVWLSDSSGPTTISNNVVSGNSATYDVPFWGCGGISILYGSLGSSVTISNNTIADNTASACQGGGIVVYTHPLFAVTIRENTIVNNRAATGGGIAVAGGRPTISSNSLYGNTAGDPPAPNDLYNGNPYGSANINAEGNYWGTDDQSIIEDHIWHYVDDPDLGIVDFVPFRTAPLGVTPEPTSTATATRTPDPTSTPTAIWTPTATRTTSPTVTASPPPTSTATTTPTAPATETATPTFTSAATPTPTSTPPSRTPTPAATATGTPEPTATPEAGPTPAGAPTATPGPGQQEQRISLHQGWNWVSFAVVQALAHGGRNPLPSAYLREYWGSVKWNGFAAPAGALVEAFSPRGDLVGSFTVAEAGFYGYMRVYGQDPPGASQSPAIAGMRSGEAVTFRVNGYPAAPRPTPALWEQGFEPLRVDLVASEGLSVPVALGSIQGRYDYVLGEEGTYTADPARSFLNTLRELRPGRGYFLRMREAAELVLRGDPVPVDQRLNLPAGWRWIGYLPAEARDLPGALASLGVDYDFLLGEAGTYAPFMPAYFNSFSRMEPGRGYLIRTRQDTELVYGSGR